MDTLLVQPDNSDKMDAVKAFLKALKIQFTLVSPDNLQQTSNFYSETFNQKMKRAEDDKKSGNFKSIKPADLWK